MWVLKSIHELHCTRCQWWIHVVHYRSVQTHIILPRIQTTKGALRCTQWPLGAGSWTETNVPLWCGRLIMGAERGFGKSPYFPPNFAVDLKLL